jgi:hypothetical protein
MGAMVRLTREQAKHLARLLNPGEEGMSARTQNRMGSAAAPGGTLRLPKVT